MTIAAAIPSYIQIPGNGVATVFAFPFKIFVATDLIVGFITSGVYAQQPSGFIVRNVDTNGGGNVVFSTPPPPGTTVDIRSLTPETQSTEFANLGMFLPEAHTEAFDRITRIVQDLTRLTYTFGIHGPDTEAIPWAALPGPAGRRGLVLIFDPVNGLPTVAIPTPGSLLVPVSTTATATAGQTTFTLAAVPALFASLNGAVLTPDVDYVVSGATLTLTVAALKGDRLTVLALSTS